MRRCARKGCQSILAGREAPHAGREAPHAGREALGTGREASHAGQEALHRPKQCILLSDQQTTGRSVDVQLKRLFSDKML